MKQHDIQGKDKGFYFNTFPTQLKNLYSGGEDYFIAKFGDAGLLAGADGDIDSRLKSATRQAQVLERNFIEIGRWIDPIGVSRDYDVRDFINSIMPGHKQDPDLATEAHKVYPPKQILQRYRKMKDWSEFEEIKDWAYNQIDNIIKTKSGVIKTKKTKLRKVQSRVIDRIMSIMDEKGIESNIIADLAPRFGKTITFIMLFKYLNEKYGHRLMVIPVYWLSSLTSFKDELNLYRDFDNMVYLNKLDNNLELEIKQNIDQGKLVIVGVSLHDTQEEFEKRYQWISRYKDLVLSVEDEADFGNHTPAQQKKLAFLYKLGRITKIKMSGTNVARMSVGWRGQDIHGLVSVPYSMIEQDTSINDIVKRSYYEMILGQSLYSKIEEYDVSIIPTWSKLGAKARANREFWASFAKDVYGYESIYGMNIDQASDNEIFYSMVFTSFTKSAMNQLAEIWNKELDNHYVVVIDGDVTTNAKAQNLVKNLIHHMKIGYIKKDKLIIITNMMGSRSFSVEEIQATLFLKDGGSLDTFIQQSQRDKTPGFNKKYGYTFDFGFDTNKLSNISLSIIYEAKQVSKELGKTLPESVRFIFNSLNLARVDEFRVSIKNADSVLEDWEDDNKILNVADESADYNSILNNNHLIEILMKVNIDSIKSLKKKITKKLPKGKTYGFDRKSLSDNEINTINKVIKEAIKNINRSATTVYDYANGGGSFRECLDLIDSKGGYTVKSFEEMYGVSPADVKSLLPYLQEHFLDICVSNSAKEF